MALSEFIDRYSRPKTGAATCWESILMDPNWMRRQSFPLVVRAPPFPGGNLNQKLYQYCCRTDVPFIRCRYSLGNGSRLLRWFSVSRSFLLGHCALFLACTNRFLVNQLDKGKYFKLLLRPTYTMFLCKCPLLCIRVRDDGHPNLHNSTWTSHDSIFEAELPEWCDPMTYTIARLMDHVQMKVISENGGSFHNCNTNDSDPTFTCHYGHFMA